MIKGYKGNHNSRSYEEYSICRSFNLPYKVKKNPSVLFTSLTEYSRYMHAHLDTPLSEYNIDTDLPGKFKEHWAKKLPFLIDDYEEQPGLQPHIK